jgi:hypothetical protein
VECVGHGRAKEGDREILPDCCEKGQGVNRVGCVPKAQVRRGDPRPALVPFGGQAQDDADRKGENAQERSRAAPQCHGKDYDEDKDKDEEDDQGAEERDIEITQSRHEARGDDDRDEARKIGGHEIASQRKSSTRSG